MTGAGGLGSETWPPGPRAAGRRKEAEEEGASCGALALFPLRGLQWGRRSGC